MTTIITTQLNHSWWQTNSGAQDTCLASRSSASMC
uniref:Uncharacterized protein n=1 Tax=Arundo donax TaxID=35708 RepID=A0A0A9KWU4_ARUDO